MSKALNRPRRRGRAADEEHWIPLSDLMTGLMFLFLVISLAYMVQAQQDAGRMTRLTDVYRDNRSKLYADLQREFHGDLKKWGAELTPDLVVRFNSPDVLFENGSDVLRPRFQQILSDFFPRYVHLLDSAKYRDAIKEVRIEGHTSSSWEPGASPQEAYIQNMALSQGRTRSVLSYVLGLPSLQGDDPWLMAHVTANGLSSSRPVMTNGKEDPVRSQRVEFRVIDNLDERIEQVADLEKIESAAAGGAAAVPLAAAAANPPAPAGALPFYSIDAIVIPPNPPLIVDKLARPRVSATTGDSLELRGWATDRAAKRPASAVYITVDKSKYIKAEYGALRDDVAQVLHDPGLRAVGFTVDVPAYGLKPGKHTIDLLIVNADGNGFFVAPSRVLVDVKG